MAIIAICQIDIVHGNPEVNRDRVMHDLRAAEAEGAELAVFPELCLSGYRFELMGDLRSVAMTVDDPVLESVREFCYSCGMTAVVGFIERAGNQYYNTAAALGSEIMLYRKIHLPTFGADQFVEAGNLGFPVFELPALRIGINICFDQRFPESARALALQGADLIVVPTSETAADHPMLDALTRARAYENRVYYALVNRVGMEFGIAYNGASRIIDPLGNVVSTAGTDVEEILYADIDVALARDKLITIEPGNGELDLLGDRRPEAYGVLCRP